MSEETKSGSWKGWSWLIAVVAILGAAYLYQREGGALFSPSKITDLHATFDTGVLSHDLVITNTCPQGDLYNVDVTIRIISPDFITPKGKGPDDRPYQEIIMSKQSWAVWKKGESKRISLSPKKYPNTSIFGSAQVGRSRVEIGKEWSWTWGEK